jgi:hypothetical protein
VLLWHSEKVYLTPWTSISENHEFFVLSQREKNVSEGPNDQGERRNRKRTSCTTVNPGEDEVIPQKIQSGFVPSGFNPVV